MMRLSEKLARLKSRRGLTTDALSLKSGVPKGTINKLLNGETRNPTIGTLKALAGALECPLEWLSVEGPAAVPPPQPADIPGVRRLGDAREDHWFDNLMPVLTRRVPLLGSIAAGEPILAEQELAVADCDAGIHCDFALRAGLPRKEWASAAVRKPQIPPDDVHPERVRRDPHTRPGGGVYGNTLIHTIGKGMIPMSIQTVREYLAPLGLAERILEFETSSATVELAARAAGVIPARIAKSLSLMLPEGPILLVTAGDTRIDNPRFKAQFHAKAKMLGADEVPQRIGHAVGGVCPFAIHEGVRTFLDVSLKRFDTVFPACGSANSAIELSCEALEAAAQNFAGWVDVCKGWQDATLS